jgi:glycosyltransferase involved in cell wall biosynthesis
MLILFLNPIGNIGGAERVLLTAIAGLRRECPSAEVHLVCLSDGPLLAEAAKLGAKVEVVPAPRSLSSAGDSQLRGGGWWGKAAFAVRAAPASIAGLRLVARLRTVINRIAPHIVHSNGIKTHLLSRFAVPRGIPVVWHVHDFYSLRPAAARLLRRLSGRVLAAVAISEAVAVDAAKVLPAIRVATAPNAIDLERFSPGPGDADNLDQAAGLPAAPPGTVRVGLVASYARWKGHLTLLDAAAKLAEEALPIRWYIVGGPIYHTAAQFSVEELKSAVDARGLSDRVGFIGFTADTPSVYRSLDIVVHASTLPEPFGLTIAEAMACARPVIVSAAGGAAELFTDGMDALGYQPGNAAELASAVRRLAEQETLRVRLAESARRTAEVRFDPHQYGIKLLAVYQLPVR